MALTNAERQARYRKRLRERASLEALPERARVAADAAVSALWAFYSRPTPDGAQRGDFDGFANEAEFRQSMVGTGQLADFCRAFLRDAKEDGATDEEIAAWTVVVESYDALTLKGG